MSELLANEMGTRQELQTAVNRAFEVLAMRGVPKSRARTIANGIDVLSTRYNADLVGYRETIRRLNRRCQIAESAVRENAEACRHEGISLGRRLANAEASRLQARVEELERELRRCRQFQQSVSEALNSGDGVYRP